MSAATRRPGFAVATAVFALLVVGALAVGSLIAATREMRSGSDTILQARAIMAAELGLESTVATWNREWNGAIARGFWRTWSSATPEGSTTTVRLSRLTDELFLIASEARAGPARRQIARVVRLDSGDPPLLATLAAGATVDSGSGDSVDGSDRVPAGWECPPAGSALAPFAVADTGALLRFGHFDWSKLVELANARISQRIISAAPRSTDEECDTTEPNNWGEPAKSNGGVCSSYYPVIHAPSDLTVDGGRGQGLLVVDGNLTLQGGVEFFGVVLVRGALIAGPGGGRITGAASVAGQGESRTLLNGIAIDFSRCTARKALLGTAIPVPVVERSWSEGFPDP